MKFEKGEWENLTGNGIVYWKVVGHNVMEPGSEIIAANFTISSLPLENKLLTATFPPIPFKDYDEFMDKILNVNCDIIFAGRIKFPENEGDFQKFYKAEFDKYNKIIEKYLEKFKEKFEFHPEHLNEKDKLLLLDELTKKLRAKLKHAKGIKRVPGGAKWIKWRKLVENIKECPKYDLEPLAGLIDKPGPLVDELVFLYTQKYLAIYFEHYEQAKDLNIQIKEKESVIDIEDIIEN